MASTSIPLKLFPSAPSATLPPPRKSSLKHAAQAGSTELKGLALQVTARQDDTPTVQPASSHIKHSLFCDPDLSTSGSPSQAQPKRQAHTRRRSSRNNLIFSSTPSSSSSPPQAVDEDQLAPLPINTHFGSIPPRRKPSSHLKRPALPWSISVEAQPDVDLPLKDDDQLSPLPEKIRFTPTSPRLPEYPSSLSGHSNSPPSTRSNSTKGKQTRPVPEYSGSVHSMFPQYDHSKPLNEQQYYPTTAPAQPLPNSKISRISSPVERPDLKQFDSKMTLVDGYEHIPSADHDDLLAIWNAAEGKSPTSSRKVKLGLHESMTQDTSIAIGLSLEKPLYCMEKALAQSEVQSETPTRDMTVEKVSPQNGDTVPVIQLALPLSAKTDSSKLDTVEVAVIFPHQAVVHAIEAVANSPAASAIATFDPTAASPQAARLAQDAVSEARRRYGCTIARGTRKRDGLGAVTAHYNLEHPTLGAFPLTVAQTKKADSRESRCKISLHHPTATPAAIAAESLVLIFLDFARDACVVDVPGLLALDTPYIIDTAISTLLAIAALENEAEVKKTMTFAPPPKTPIKESSGKTRSKARVAKTTSSKRKWYKRSSRAIDKVEKALVGDPVDVPAVTRGAIALLGLSLKGAVFLLETGVRATASVVTHIVK